MPKLKDLPESERPREKAIRFGIESLSSIELLAILLGNGTKDNNVLELSSTLFVGAKGLNGLFSMPYQEFIKFKGISKANGLKLSAISELAKRYLSDKNEQENITVTNDYLYFRYAPLVIGQTTEQVILVILNKSGKILHEKTLFIGVENNVEISIKEIFRNVILYKGYYYYLLHNHPNETLEPSSFDVVFSEDLEKLSKRMDIHLKDHLILTSKGYYSMHLKSAKVF